MESAPDLERYWLVVNLLLIGRVLSIRGINPG